jgi:hypothetical protein
MSDLTQFIVGGAIGCVIAAAMGYAVGRRFL